VVLELPIATQWRRVHILTKLAYWGREGTIVQLTSSHHNLSVAGVELVAVGRPHALREVEPTATLDDTMGASI